MDLPNSTMPNLKNPNNFATFLLYTGYVESNAIAPVVFNRFYANEELQHFDTEKDALIASLKDLKKVILTLVKLETGVEEITTDDVWDFLDRLRKCDNDSVGPIWDEADSLGWFIGAVDSYGAIVVIHENAEVLMSQDLNDDMILILGNVKVFHPMKEIEI